MANLYRVLCFEERKQIEKLLKKSYTCSEIGREIGRSKNCIVTEVRRNGGRDAYSAKAAQQRFLIVHEEGMEKKKESAPKGDPNYKIKSAIQNLELQIEIICDAIKEMRDKLGRE